MENLQKRPSKGILKSSSSFEQQNEVNQKQVETNEKDIKWDEMNILQTLHPVDKDYGHMKIEEPKTPFNYYSDQSDGEHHESHAIDPKDLEQKLSNTCSEPPKVFADVCDDEDENEEEYESTEEEKKLKKEFEMKRKMHYNEFEAVKLARKLLEEEEDDDEDDEQQSNGNNGNATHSDQILTQKM